MRVILPMRMVRVAHVVRKIAKGEPLAGGAGRRSRVKAPHPF
jgi:hypothetical protein